jgi:peroxiredoxin
MTLQLGEEAPDFEADTTEAEPVNPNETLGRRI